MAYLYVAFGGAFGSLCRYLLQLWMTSHFGRAFPYGTLAVNVIGGFLFGLMVGMLAGMMPKGRELYLLLGVGALGGFTTFSAFSFDLYLLIEKGLYAQAALYAGLSVFGSVAALFAGMWMFKSVAL